MEIEKGIDINNYGSHGYTWEFLKNMEVGDSVLLTEETAKEINERFGVRQARYEMVRALRRFGMKGKSRTVQDGNIRVWRIQ